MRSSGLGRVRAPVKRIDALIVSALVLAVVGTALGIATYEDDRRASFLVRWTTVSEPLDLPLTGSAPDLEGSIDITSVNLTRALWAVTVTGGAARAQPAAIHVEITAPDNSTTAADAQLPAGPTTSVDVPLDFVLSSVPNATSITAPSVDAARAGLNATLGSTNGTGTWTLRVSIAPTAPGPLGGLEPYSATAAVRITSYLADVAPETPEVARG